MGVRARENGTIMRSVIRCIVLVALAIGTIGLPNAAQAATKRTVSLAASTATPAASSVVTFTGTVSRSPKRTVVQLQRASGSRWVKVTTTRTTSSRGAFSVRARVPGTGGDTRYRAYAPSTSKLRAATSAPRTLDVRRPVTISSDLSPTVVGAGSNTVLSGTVSPAVAGTTVTIQKVVGTSTTLATTAVVTSGGRYSATLPQPTAGTMTYRASMPARRGYLAAVSASRSVEVRDVPVPPRISTSSLPAGAAGALYSSTLRTEGNQPGTWSVSPALPTGLVLDPLTGTISGIPVTRSSGSYRFTFTHTNGFPAEKSLTLTITAPPRITTTSLPDTTVGTPYDEQLAVDGGPGRWTIIAGTTPPGTGLGSDGRLTGKPTTTGTSTFTVAFKDTATGLADRRQLSVVVREKAIATTGLAAGAVGRVYAFQLRTNGKVAGTWRTQSGAALPQGFTLTSAGLLSGTPTSAGVTQVLVEFQRTGSNAAEKLSVPLTIEPDRPFTTAATSISAGDGSACRVAADRSLSCWGFNFMDHFGIGSTSSTTYSAPTTGPSGSWTATSVSAYAHSCAIRSDASLWCMGYNGNGQLGTGRTDWESAPARVSGTGVPTAWKQVAADQSHTCGISSGDELWCWGMGQAIGTPSRTTDALSPVRVGTGWKKLSTGGASCGIKIDDSLWCWGYGTKPTQVGSATWRSVSRSTAHTCGIQTDGSMWCWGGNAYGQLGNGTTTDTTRPTRVGSRTDWAVVSAGGRNSQGFTCATTTAGEAWCWGINDDGQLGNGSTTPSAVPARIDTTTSWSSIAAGAGFACGVKSDESQRCWGKGTGGQLGDGRSSDSTVPVTVAATKAR